MAFLTTGQAARLLSVTPDTVLKWIKSGRIRAQRTIGGHYRVDERDLAPLARLFSPAAPAPGRRHQYCWEYNSETGQLLASCKKCLVYKTRAYRCYEVVKLNPAMGQARLFCQKSCDDCEYYRRVHKQATNVLVVSDNQILTTELQRRSTVAPFNIEVTDCEYACSMLVERFRPDYAVIDCSLGEERTRDMCRHLLEDPRIPSVRLILAAAEGEFPRECDKEIFARIVKPFGINDIAECLEGVGLAVALQRQM